MNTVALTVGGDSVDPGGIMQGGTRNNMGAVIRDCASLYEAVNEVREMGHAIAMMNQQLQTAQANEQFIQQLEKTKRELHHIDEMRKLTKYSQIKEEIETLDRELPEVNGKRLEPTFKRKLMRWKANKRSK